MTVVVPSIPEKPVSSIPLTGDSQTDSDILAFIKARQSILQKKCKFTCLQGHRSPALLTNSGGRPGER